MSGAGDSLRHGENRGVKNHFSGSPGAGTAPNKRVQATANSLCSSVAPAIGGA
jgi:hypothetical protein